jgi:hypothetical protein
MNKLLFEPVQPGVRLLPVPFGHELITNSLNGSGRMALRVT